MMLPAQDPRGVSRHQKLEEAKKDSLRISEGPGPDGHFDVGLPALGTGKQRKFL